MMLRSMNKSLVLCNNNSSITNSSIRRYNAMLLKRQGRYYNKTNYKYTTSATITTTILTLYHYRKYTNNDNNTSLTTTPTIPIKTITIPSSSLLQQLNHYLNKLLTKLKNTILILIRSSYQIITLSPIIITLPLYILNIVNNQWWWDFIRYCIKNSGSCNTKFAQWIATRPDLFPLSLCNQLQLLQSNTKITSWKHCQNILYNTFGSNWNSSISIDMSNDDKDTPIFIGSGCVAQVLKGKVNNRNVAIKIIHPAIKKEIEADIRIMKFVTWLIDMLPGFQNLSLSESVEEFEGIMMSQLDLTQEANNLMMFRKNFKNTNITFPEPIEGYISSSVLIESYEDGILVSDMLNTSDLNTKKKLALLGLNAILKMTFLDNFIHADLHPGNIIVKDKGNGNIELSMIDAGIVAKLLPEDRKNFIELFDAVIKNDGKRVGKLMIERSRGGICINEDNFMKELDDVVKEVHNSGLSLGRIGIGPLLQKVLVACYNHGVKIESRFAIVIIALGISEGLGRRLDPDVDILKCAVPYVIKASLGLH